MTDYKMSASSVTTTVNHEVVLGNLHIVVSIKNNLFDKLIVEKNLQRGTFLYVVGYEDLLSLWNVMKYLNGLFNFDRNEKGDATR